MIEAKGYCPDIMIQIRAAQSALKALEAAVLSTTLGGYKGSLFNVVDNTGLKAYVFQFEFSEKPLAMGVSVPEGEVKIAVLDGSTIPSEEYKDYPALEKIKSDMVEKLRGFRKGAK